MEVTVKAPAKINLTLDVTGRREDGYHLIESVMQAIDLCDVVTVYKTGHSDIRLEIDDERVPDDERNTAWRAAAAKRQDCPRRELASASANGFPCRRDWREGAPTPPGCLSL